MNKGGHVPDAWDDDWESQADKADAEAAETAKAEEQVKVTKAQRLAKHAETNKKIWESAEAPETPFFLAVRESNVPLKQEFKPALKVLSRKPAPEIEPATGLAKLTLDDEDEEEKQNKPTPEELRLRAQKELEERKRKYEQRRAELMADSGKKTPGIVTPPNEEGRQNRGKGRGANRQENRRPDSQSRSKELFDPNYTPKPGVTIQKRTGNPLQPARSTPKEDDQIIRKPRGPDASGGGGFGKRGGQTS